jgi:hypothetical protein
VKEKWINKKELSMTNYEGEKTILEYRKWLTTLKGNEESTDFKFLQFLYKNKAINEKGIKSICYPSQTEVIKETK